MRDLGVRDLAVDHVSVKDSIELSNYLLPTSKKQVDYKLVHGRADGMPNSLESMVLCGGCSGGGN